MKCLYRDSSSAKLQLQNHKPKPFLTDASHNGVPIDHVQHLCRFPSLKLGLGHNHSLQLLSRFPTYYLLISNLHLSLHSALEPSILLSRPCSIDSFLHRSLRNETTCLFFPLSKYCHDHEVFSLHSVTVQY